jgi:DNA-binding XRE family transcriptional regulator
LTQVKISVAVHLSSRLRGLGEVVRLERHALAAKVRLVRAVLGWSQTELGRRVGLTQRAIHKLEQGETEPRRTTVHALEAIWREQNIDFEDLAEGGFSVNVRASALDRPAMARSRRGHAARTRLGAATIRPRVR